MGGGEGGEDGGITWRGGWTEEVGGEGEGERDEEWWCLMLVGIGGGGRLEGRFGWDGAS